MDGTSPLPGGHIGSGKLDGYCFWCKQNTTYTIDGISIPAGDPWTKIKQRHAFDGMDITCARHNWHRIHYWFRIGAMKIEKVGQYPSLADIAIDETRQKYKSVLRGKIGLNCTRLSGSPHTAKASVRSTGF